MTSKLDGYEAITCIPWSGINKQLRLFLKVEQEATPSFLIIWLDKRQVPTILIELQEAIPMSHDVGQEVNTHGPYTKLD